MNSMCVRVIQCCMNSSRLPLLLISTSVIQSNQIRNQLSALFCRSTGDSHKASLLIYIQANAGSSEYKVDIYTLHHGFLSNTFQFPPRMRTVVFFVSQIYSYEEVFVFSISPSGHNTGVRQFIYNLHDYTWLSLRSKKALGIQWDSDFHELCWGQSCSSCPCKYKVTLQFPMATVLKTNTF